MPRLPIGIYKITNTANGKIYVGQTIDLARRKQQHFAELRSGRHENKGLQADFTAAKGRGFRFDIIEYCSLNELNEREDYWIKTLNTQHPNGYNRGWQRYTHIQKTEEEIKRDRMKK